MACAQQSKKTNPSPNLLSLDTMTTEYLLDTLEASINLSKDSISKLEADYQEPTNLTKKKLIKPLIVPSEEDNLPISTTSMSTKDQNASNQQQKKLELNKQALVSTTKKAEEGTQNIETTALSHAMFDALLQKHVSAIGVVNYEGLGKEKTKLSEYIEQLKKNAPNKNWSSSKEMAYWINLYNAFTIHSILEKYPINSILDLEGGNIWDNKKILIDGKNLSLNQIEKDKLLKRFKEPRVHFAVNCAAKSCPPLLNKAWTEDNIDAYLSKQAKVFINNPKYNKISPKKIEVSQIFNWYADDFGGKSNLIKYLNQYTTEKITPTASLQFVEYDWSLNNK
jgi:hypothetical protein